MHRYSINILTNVQHYNCLPTCTAFLIWAISVVGFLALEASDFERGLKASNKDVGVDLLGDCTACTVWYTDSLTMSSPDLLRSPESPDLRRSLESDLPLVLLLTLLVTLTWNLRCWVCCCDVPQEPEQAKFV